MSKVMTDREYANAIGIIHAMDSIMRSLNDEYAMAYWLMDGVPDGSQTVTELYNDYSNDEEFSAWFNDLSALFCRIIARQTISKVVDGRAVLDGNAVLYVGQDVNARL